MLVGGLEIPLWLVLVPLTAYLWYRYLTRNFDAFTKTGIPGPKPLPIIGTIHEFYKRGHLTKVDTIWREKYGKFVGTFDGSSPVLIVFDPEWLKEAFIKHFRVFTNRRRVNFGESIGSSLFGVEDEHWKHNRKTLSSEFSSGKLKKMMAMIGKCTDRFLDILRKSKGSSVEIRNQVSLLTIDVISNTAFGIDVQAQTKLEDNQFVDNVLRITGGFNAAQASLREQIRVNVAIQAEMILPTWIKSLLRKVFDMNILDSEACDYFEKLTNSLIEERQMSTGRHDFLQTLTDNLVEANKSDPDTLRSNKGHLWTHKGLTKPEVIGNTILFLNAGFQTTAETMMYVFYELAMNPEVQQKLYKEVTSVCDTEELTVEQANQLKYLDYCINEAMRLYPQGFRFDRNAAEDVEIQGIKISKGTAVTASSWVIHRDAEYWENPEEYQPERFAPENFTEKQATAFIPFGIGNRMCIGNRLALLEMKATMVSVVKNFSIDKTIDTPLRPLKFRSGLNLSPEKPIMLGFTQRS